MFLAEALSKRKRLVTEISDLQSTALSTLWTDAVDNEEEKPNLEQIALLRKELRDLIYVINMTNSSCEMTKLISERDHLKAEN